MEVNIGYWLSILKPDRGKINSATSTSLLLDTNDMII